MIRTLALVAALAVGLATGCPARPAAADEPRSGATLDQLFQQLLADPGNSELILRYADVAEQRGDLEAAIGALERALAARPGLVDVRLRLGLLYARLGSYDMARAYLEPLAADAALAPEMRDQAQAALRVVNKLASPHRFSATLFVGAQSQSNPGALPGSPDILVAGVDTLVGSSFVKHQDFDGFAKGEANYRYDLGTPFRDAIEARGIGYASVFAQQNQLDLALGEVSLGPRFALERAGLTGGDVSPYLIADYVRLGGALYYTAYGGGLNLRQRLGAGLPALTIDVQSRQANYSSSTNYPTANLLTGRIDRFALGLRQGVAQLGTFALDGTYTRQNARAAFYANGDAAVEASFLFGFDAGALSFGFPWQMSLNGAHHWIDYDAADPSVSPGTTRHDLRWQFGLAQTIPLSARIAAVAQLYRDIDSSNVRNYSYTNTSFLLGLQFGL